MTDRSAGIVGQAAISAVSAIIGGLIVAVPSYLTRDRELDVKMVEIAVGILAQEPKENIAPARKWAVDVIAQYSRVALSPEVRNALTTGQAIGPDWLDLVDPRKLPGPLEMSPGVIHPDAVVPNGAIPK
ncbi:hypothetical protein [Afifella aestuarii]|uniref:hypothetical protein n=1 Tax=Afifella aestuarii TaxID=1909496 RepID=UPI000FE30011|nr:hypothetical protein [Afifella aestuarii]